MTEDNPHWHLDKRLSVSHIVTTVGALIAALWWAGEVETRVAVIENSMKHEGRQIQEIRQDVKEIKKYLLTGAGDR